VEGFWPLAVVPFCCALALWLRMVKVSGAIAGMGVAAAVAYGAGWPGLVMLAAVLLIGHTVTVGSRRRRGAWQVLCNGGVAALSALHGSLWAIPAMAGALATSLSDTAGGELGQRLGGQPRFLLLGRQVPVGADGGMSVVGTSVGLLMALLVPAAGWAAGAPFDLATILAVTAGGFGGHALDSLLGATVQRHMGSRGNDWTNLLATLCGAAITVLLLLYVAPAEVYAAHR
jgi:uncharacterized protein (TIGR00297 family)